MFRNPLSPRSQPILTLATDDNTNAMELSDDEEDIPEIIVTEIQTILVASTTHQITISPPLSLTSNLVLREMCNNIFNDLEDLVNSRNKTNHLEIYEDKWNNLKELVNKTFDDLLTLYIQAQK
jgi:hypothetical protein